MKRNSFLCRALLAALLASTCVASSWGQTPDALARAQAALDAQQPEEALKILEPILAKDPNDGHALLLRSSAYFILGDTAKGKKDLDRAVKVAPDLRQAWLNRAALEMSEKRYDDALTSLLRAKKLDPNAPDNDLNLGAARLLLGKVDAASADFERYLAHNPRDAQAHYLVASNYALSGYAALANRYLAEGVALDERVRMQARTDPNFAQLAENPRFQELLNTDSFVPAPGSLHAERTFPGAYKGGQGALLEAMLSTLHAVNEPFQSRIEVAPEWALIWGEIRIKLSDASGGKGKVELTAPPGRFTPAEWQKRTQRLFSSLLIQVERIVAHRHH